MRFFCAVLFVVTSSLAHAQGSDTLVDLMHKLKATESEGHEKRLAALYEAFASSTAAGDRKLLSLALGVHNIEPNPRLALQYLSSAELSCKDDDPLLSIVRYYKAEAQFDLGAFADAARIAQGLLNKELGDAWDKKIYNILIESYHEGEERESLLSAFQAFGKRFSFSKRQERLARLAAEALARQGKNEQEIELLEEISRSYPTSEDSRWAFHRLLDMGCEKNPTPYRFSRDLLVRLGRNSMLNTGLTETFVGLAFQPLKFSPTMTRHLTQSERADFFFDTRQYDFALRETKELLEAEEGRADSKELPRLLVDVGRIHMRMMQPEPASRVFARFLELYPNHALAPRVQELLGDAMRYLGLPRAASELYALAATKKDSKLLRWHQFWATYRSGDYANALRHLALPGLFGARDGDDGVLVAYWKGKINEKLGKKAEAKAAYMTVLSSDADGYYGNLVAAAHPEWTSETPTVPVAVAGRREKDEKIEKGGGLRLAAKLLIRSAAPIAEAAPSSASVPPAQPELRLVDDLLAVGLREAATIQLAGLSWNNYSQEEAFAAVSRLAWALGDYMPSRKIRFSPISSLRFVPRGWKDYAAHLRDNSDEWKVHYPVAFEQTVRPVAEKVGIDPYLILSVMRAESYYNRDARSPVGATGLMQLMPYTALKLASLNHHGDFEVGALDDPQTNISYGGFYLAKLVKYYSGNLYLAAAAYNGGPSNVNFWLDACKGCTTDEFVEAIPFRETRGYVRKVMANYAHYQRLYEGKTTLAELPALPTTLPVGEEIF